MKKAEEMLCSSNGVELYTVSYFHPKPQAIVIVAHGLNERVGQYESLVQALWNAGCSVYLYNWRHQGTPESPKRPKHLQHASDAIEDLELVVEQATAREAEKRTFIVAHDEGAAICLSYCAARMEPEIAGVVLFTPTVHPSNVGGCADWLMTLLRLVWPRWHVTVMRHGTRQEMTLRTLRLSTEWAHAAIAKLPRMKTPLILLCGKDDDAEAVTDCHVVQHQAAATQKESLEFNGTALDVWTGNAEASAQNEHDRACVVNWVVIFEAAFEAECEMHAFSAVFLLVQLALRPILGQVYYGFDGQGNNVNNPEWGSVGHPYVRRQVSVAAGYGDGSTLTGADRPNPRAISQGLSLPAGRHKVRSKRQATDMLTYIGQFFDHDIDLTTGADPGEAADIEIPLNDPDFDPEGVSTVDDPLTMPFGRSNYAIVEGVREQINSITAYIDGSVVYGETAEKADNLRSHRGGKLLTYDSDMLPFATAEMGVSMAADSGKESVVRAAGDFRGNVNPPILALQTLFLREHNRLATELQAAHPDWDDETLYQEARKWNVGYLQSICFYEYIPMLGIQLEAYSGYKPSIDASVDNFFSTVSYRYGHSEVGDIIFRLDENGNEISEGHVPLFEAFFYPTFALNAGIDPILRGMAWRHQMEVDAHFASSIQNFLFGDPGNGGTDLTARNIQRGRDHGIPDYNTCREDMGLAQKTSFTDITSESFTAVKLEEIYGTVDKIDAYIGGLAEDHVHGSNLGELFYDSLKDQYTRLRDGDRFYFENKDNQLFTDEEISQIRAVGLRDVILRNTDIQRLPDNIYFRMANDKWPTA